MNRYRLFIYAAIFSFGYACSVLVAALIEPDGKPAVANSIAGGSSTPANSTESSLNERIRQLELYTKTLETKLALIDTNAAAASTDRKIPPAKDDTSVNRELAALRDYRARNELDKHTASLQSIGATPANISAVLDRRFKTETIDGMWAAEKEAWLNNAITQNNKEFAQLSLTLGECRSTQCKVSVLSDDPRSLGGLPDSLNRIIAERHSGFGKFTTVADPRTNTTTVYFDRDLSGIQSD